jgi:iron complex transport system substrate-binding protein
MWRNFILILIISSCKQANQIGQNASSNKNNTIKEAKRFAIFRNKNYQLLYCFGNRNNFDTTSKFILAEDTIGLSVQFPVYKIIKKPLKSIAAMGCTYANMLDALGSLNALSAIDNIDYVSNAAIINKFNNKQLIELARSPQIDLEKTIRLNPQLIINFGMGEGEKDIDKKLELTNIPVAIVVDHLEATPLARAEWIKFIAAFVGKDESADSIFNITYNNYHRLKHLLDNNKLFPTVFSEVKLGDVWYMPGGKSFMSTMLKDAGANYLWQDNNQTGSIPLSFEQVVAKAKDADYWINLSTFKTKENLLQNESRYVEFKAFKTSSLYNNNRCVNANGYSDYWETGMIYPDRILSDLIQIFHPEIKMNPKVNLYYYKQLN